MKDGAHTHGPQGGGLVLAVIAAVVLAGSGAASAVASAVVTIAITAAVAVSVAIAGVIGLLVYRTRSERRRRPIPAPVVSRIGPAQRPELSESHKPAAEQFFPRAETNQAIGTPREVHFHLNVTPDQLAAIMRRIEEE